MVPDVTAASEPAEAAAMNCRLVKSFIFISNSFQLVFSGNMIFG